MTENEYNDAVKAEHERCVRIVKEFASEYVGKWVCIQGDRAKAEGWAILQASAALQRALPTSEKQV